MNVTKNYKVKVTGVTSRTVFVEALNSVDALELAAQEFTGLVGAEDVLDAEIVEPHIYPIDQKEG